AMASSEFIPSPLELGTGKGALVNLPALGPPEFRKQRVEIAFGTPENIGEALLQLQRKPNSADIYIAQAAGSDPPVNFGIRAAVESDTAFDDRAPALIGG